MLNYPDCGSQITYTRRERRGLSANSRSTRVMVNHLGVKPRGIRLVQPMKKLERSDFQKKNSSDKSKK